MDALRGAWIHTQMHINTHLTLYNLIYIATIYIASYYRLMLCGLQMCALT